MYNHNSLFWRYKLLIGILILSLGFTLLLLPSWVGWTTSNPSLATLVQAIGSFLSASIALVFLRGALLKEYEDMYLMEGLKQVVNEVVSPISCRNCLAIINKCRPETLECMRISDALVFEQAILQEQTNPIASYDSFVEHLKRRLNESTESLHVMPLSRESVRNFYDGQSGGLGTTWREAQRQWASRNGKTGLRRVALLDEKDLVDPKFKEDVQRVLSSYNTLCDLLLVDVSKARRALNNPGFVPRDFGIFINDGKAICALFTFNSVCQGNCFLKSAGKEYFSRSPIVLELLQHYFIAMWANTDLRRESEVLLGALGIKS